MHAKRELIYYDLTITNAMMTIFYLTLVSCVCLNRKNTTKVFLTILNILNTQKKKIHPLQTSWNDYHALPIVYKIIFFNKWANFSLLTKYKIHFIERAKFDHNNILFDLEKKHRNIIKQTPQSYMWHDYWNKITFLVRTFSNITYIIWKYEIYL